MANEVYTSKTGATQPAQIYALYAPTWMGPDVASMMVDSYTRHPYKRALIKMTEFLPRIKALGTTHVYVGALLASPWHDMGFDTADYTMMDPRLGENRDFEEFIRRAHELGLKVVMDLVLNHTSTYHRWFHTEPELYCWSNHVHPGWANLFGDETGAWEWDIKRGQFYLHLFQRTQADLNWFPNGASRAPNAVLVERFRNIASYWLKHGVDGFRLDAPQALNKDLMADTLTFEDLMFGSGPDVDVINAIFTGDGAPKTENGDKPFLFAEVFDPTFGEVTDFYTANAPVIDFYVNPLLVDTVYENADQLRLNIASSVENPKVMVALESHDAPRFRSRSYAPEQFPSVMELLTDADPLGIYLYQGQELGLFNPTKSELPDSALLKFDAQSALEHAKLDQVKKFGPEAVPIPAEARARSRANARVPLSLKEYEFQEANGYSNLGLAITILHNWARRVADQV